MLPTPARRLSQALVPPPPGEPLPLLARAALVAGTVAAGLLAALGLDAVTQREALLPLVAAVLASTWLGGIGAGLAATGLAALAAAYFVLEPTRSLAVPAPADLAWLAALVIAALLAVAAAAFARRGRRLLHEQWALCQVTLGSIGDAVIVTDAEGRVTFMNPVGAALTGWRLDEATGRPLADVFQILEEGSRRPADNPVARVLRDGVVVGLSNDTLLVRRDGTERPIDDSGAPIRDGSGAVMGVVVVFRDVTERRRAEEERTYLLGAERAARSRAEVLNRAKDEFLATVSHELRTPLTAILGWARLLRTSTLDAPTTTRALETIERNAKLQAQLIDDLLDISRVVTGKVHLDVRPVDLVSVAQAVLEAFSPAADAKRIRMQATLDPGAGSVLGDAARLQQVVWNLVSNAIKFTPEGGAMEVVLASDPDRVTLQVRDTGIGISPDFLPHVFDRFSQEEGGTTRRRGGLGLGLSIVRHLVELHGGTVRAESPGEGQGATVTVVLPGLAGPGPVEVPGPAEAPAVPQAALGGRRVLLVEDEADTRDLLATALARYGAAVTTAASTAEALELLETLRPDVLVTDIAMPGADGYELIRRLRARSTAQGRDVPAVALTAHARPEDRARALAAGFQAHLAKPVEPAALARVVASLAGGPPDVGS
jgi:PAS domain S-box-containing protein